MLSLDERAARTSATVERFRPKRFDWSKKATCIHLVRTQLAAFDYPVPIVPEFRTPIGARRALTRAGFRTLRALLGSMLPEIPPAAMLVGDIALLPGEPFEAITLHDGGGLLLGWHEGSDRFCAIERAVGSAIAAFRL